MDLWGLVMNDDTSSCFEDDKLSIKEEIIDPEPADDSSFTLKLVATKCARKRTVKDKIEALISHDHNYCCKKGAKKRPQIEAVSKKQSKNLKSVREMIFITAKKTLKIDMKKIKIEMQSEDPLTNASTDVEVDNIKVDSTKINVELPGEDSLIVEEISDGIKSSVAEDTTKIKTEDPLIEALTVEEINQMKDSVKSTLNSNYQDIKKWIRNSLKTDESVQITCWGVSDFETFTNKTFEDDIYYRNTTPNDLKWFKCDQCPFTSTVSFYLKNHIKNRHSTIQNIFHKRTNPTVIDFQWLKDFDFPLDKPVVPQFKLLGNGNKNAGIKRNPIESADKAESSFQTLASNKRTESTSNKVKYTVFKCFACKFEAYRRLVLIGHIFKMHKEKFVYHDKPDGLRGYLCFMCNFKCIDIEGLRSHFVCKH